MGAELKRLLRTSEEAAEQLGTKKRVVLLNDAGGAQAAEGVGAACEVTYLSIQETVEHRNHKALRGGWGGVVWGGQRNFQLEKHVQEVVVQLQR